MKETFAKLKLAKTQSMLKELQGSRERWPLAHHHTHTLVDFLHQAGAPGFGLHSHHQNLTQIRLRGEGKSACSLLVEEHIAPTLVGKS